MSTLPGLTSRWMTPWRWAKSRAPATSAAMEAARPGSSGPLADQLGQGPAVDVLHDDEVGALALAPVVDRDDVRMGEVGGGLGLPPEALDEGVVDRQLREQDLQRHRTVEQQVLGQVHLGHPAPGDVADQLVAVVEDLGGVGSCWRHVRPEPTGRRGRPGSRPWRSGRRWCRPGDSLLAGWFSTRTATAMVGLSAGAKAMNQACDRVQAGLGGAGLAGHLPRPGSGPRCPVPELTTETMSWVIWCRGRGRRGR